jgi:hypothetical protein
VIDSELEDQLGTALRGLAGNDESRPDLPAIAAGARRLRRRGVALRTAGVAVVVGATAVSLGLATGGGAAAQAVVAAPQHPAPLPSVYTLAADTVSAMGKQTGGGDLYSSTTVTSTGTVLDYNNPALKQTESIQQDPAGHPISVLAERFGGASPSLRVIDYRNHTYGDDSRFSGSDPNPATDLAQGLQENILLRQGESGDAKQVNKVVGTQVVDGQPAYQVLMSAPDGSGAATIWISKASSLPLKLTSPGVTVTYRWAVPTSQGPASLWPAVPSGYTAVDSVAALNTFKQGK